MQYNEDEEKCIRIIAKWFREGKRGVSRTDAMKELGVEGARYEVLIKMMEHKGVVEEVISDLRDGYATFFRPSPRAEELAREIGMESEDELRQAFKQFLLEKKEYPAEWLHEKQIPTDPKSGRRIKALDIISPDSDEVITTIGFSIHDDPIARNILTSRIRNYRKSINQAHRFKNSIRPAYIVTLAISDSPYQFDIYEAFDEGDPELIDVEDFPAYEDSTWKTETKTEAPESEAGNDDSENVFRENLIAFLINEKEFPRESMNHGIVAEAPDMDLAVVHPDTDDSLAVFDWKPGHYGKPSAEVSESMAKTYKSGLIGIQNPFAYIVHPSEESNEDFVIFEVEDDGTSYEISYGDFPTYKQLVFASPLSNKGRRICWALTRLAKDEHGFSVHAPCEDHVNLQIKKNGRTAAQIHRINDADENIALALAGYQEDFPDTQSSPYLLRGEVKHLSGYTSKFQAERNWLEGNVGHPKLIYEAGVYVLRPGALVLDEIQNEVGELLELAKSNAESKGREEFEQIGTFVKLSDDKLADKDLLGRESLVDALADIFSRTDDFRGFTVALLGEWGGGKSTVMKLLTDKLKKMYSKRFDFALFNAWEYENTDNIAAGLAQEVATGLADTKMKYIGNIPLRLAFFVYEYWSGLFRLLLYCGIASVPLFLVYYLRIEVPKEFLGVGIGGGAIGVSIYLFRNVKHIYEHPLAVKLGTFLKLPNYRKHLGLVPILKRHIEILCKVKLNAIRIGGVKWGKDRRLIVFVDDLDRCKPKCIAETLDAIRLVMTVPNVIIFICIDHRIAFKAVEKYYHELGDGFTGRSAAEIARDYLAKIIQLPINLIPVPPVEIRPFVKTKLFPNADLDEQRVKPDRQERKTVATVGEDEGESQNEKPMDNDDGEKNVEQKSDVETYYEPIAKRIEEETGSEVVDIAFDKVTDKEILGTKEEYDKFIDLIGEYGFTNPRQLLRLRNSYRLLRVMNLKLRFEWKELLTMLFWQEFLHNWGFEVRNKCIAVLWELSKLDSIGEVEARSTVEGVKKQLRKVFVNDVHYAKVARYVRMVVLPHNEEGIFDTKEEIEEWLKKKEDSNGNG